MLSSFVLRLLPAWGLFASSSGAASSPISSHVFSSLRSVADSTTRPSILVLQGGTVIDVNNGHRLTDQTVIIRDNRIQAIVATKDAHVPHGAHVVDVHGKYLIPGLWDMHAHVDNLASFFYPRYIAYGVTGLREMAQRFPGGADSLRAWQRQVMAGERIGPRVYGPSADLTYAVTIQTPEDAIHVVDSLKAAGNLFLKVHDDFMRPDLYFAVAREARKVGIPIVGHLPANVNEADASDSGQKTVEHVEENHHCWPNWPQPFDSLAPTRCAPIAAAYVRNGTWMSPTVVGAKYWPEHNEHEAQRFVHMMHGMGVRMLSGTDVNIAMVSGGFLPGESSLQDVVLLGGAMTPLEGLQAATLNPAIFMNATDSLGSVAAGKLADIVVLTGDPLADINNVRNIDAVIANGRYFDRAKLDEMKGL